MRALQKWSEGIKSHGQLIGPKYEKLSPELASYVLCGIWLGRDENTCHAPHRLEWAEKLDIVSLWRSPATLRFAAILRKYGPVQ